MEKQCSNREGFSDSPWMKKQVICSLFPQCPLNEHILNGPNQKQTNFSSFSLSEKQKPFPVGYWQNSEMNRVHEKCSNEKNNWGRWTNHSASSEANFTTFEKQQTAAPPACLPIYLHTKKTTWKQSTVFANIHHPAFTILQNMASKPGDFYS